MKELFYLNPFTLSTHSTMQQDTLLYVCMCVCDAQFFQSCSNCKVQHLCPTAVLPNHDFLSAGAPFLSSAF